ncbi:MAG: hypothetical protein OES14_00040 [Nitrosopumilus sp.]|nr:hypothetical protein [Nitrosopumilus sp.]MDH3824168.1 hypothetical protein [Nitrosopumilus sp.]
MDKVDEKLLKNPKDITITYRDKEIKIGELSDEEKIDCISRLWLYKGIIEDEKEVLQEMIQKMYFFGKMEKLEEKNE